MAGHDSPGNSSRLFGGPALLVGSIFILPVIAPSFFGWTSGLLAIPVFGILHLYGGGRGMMAVRNGLLLAAAASIILRQVPALLFSLPMVPLGYVFYAGAAGKRTVLQTGARGVLALAVGWLVLWAGLGAVTGVNPYQQLLAVLDDFFVQTYEYYRTSGEISADAMFQLEQAVNRVRQLIPDILPGLLLSSIILTVWINLVLSRSLLEKISPGSLPWKNYRLWRLPDWLIWVAIVDIAILLAGPGIAAHAVYAVAMFCGLLYLIQGLAVLLYMLDKWNVPLSLRIILCIILILQSYSLLFIAMLGVADVWMDFRTRHQADDRKDD